MARGGGPAPKPTALRVLHGDQAKRINRHEPPARPVGPQPVWLTAYAAEVWDEIVPELAYMTIAKAGDAGVIAAYCEALARLRRATEDIAARGQIVDAVDGSGRQVANPSVRMADSASTELRQVARELGLTPSARSGIHVHHHQDSEPAARLLGG